MPKIPLDRKQIKRIVAVNMRKNGYSLQEIGDTINLTRERVRQILADKDLTNKKSENIVKKNKVASAHETSN